MMVEKSIKRSYKRQIVTDTKSRNASPINCTVASNFPTYWLVRIPNDEQMDLISKCSR